MFVAGSTEREPHADVNDERSVTLLVEVGGTAECDWLSGGHSSVSLCHGFTCRTILSGKTGGGLCIIINSQIKLYVEHYFCIIFYFVFRVCK